MKLVAVVLVLIAAVWAWQRHHRIANEHALAALAGQLAGRDVGVECQGFIASLVDVEGRDGDVQFPNGKPPDHMFLTRRICKELERFRKASTHPELDCLLSVDWSAWRLETDFHSPCSDRARPAAQAINTLAHEAMHLRGFSNEAATQCYAIQQDAWTTIALGGTREQGAGVASFILAQQPALPSDYQSSDCRAGGGLDLHPETAAFPAEAVPGLPPQQLRGTCARAVVTGKHWPRLFEARLGATLSRSELDKEGRTMNGAMEKAVLAGGCFWGMQDLIRKRPGILSTRVGYSGGDVANATYRNHGTHAEAIEITFDPEQTSYRELLEFFFQIHDPTTVNRQGNDVGTSYRSAIFYLDEEQRLVAEDTIADVEASGLWPGKVVTEVTPAGPFWEAEPEHQDYLERYPHGYTCHFPRPGWSAAPAGCRRQIGLTHP